MAKRPKYTAKTADVNDLYQQSVQCPEADVRFMAKTFKKIRGRPALSLREDFCGTALLAAEWVKGKREREAYGVDLDEDVMAWGEKHNIEPLGKKAKRVHLSKGDVLTPKSPKVDIQTGFNFSYCIFQERKTLLKYFRAARRSIKDDGVFILDIHGGAEAFDSCTEEKKLPGFKYVWEQSNFSPITHRRMSYIHFKFPDGTRIKKAYAYKWRVWTCPELLDLLEEAGFKETQVYWEGTDDETGEGDGIYRITKDGDNDPSWIAYLIALK